MSTFRGLEGFLSLGGVLSGAGAPPKLNGALSAGVSTMNIDGNGAALNGVVVFGDRFTIAGESGSPTHQVTGGFFYVAVGNAISGITFSPSIATGGVADNAVVTFSSNSVAEAKLHTVNATQEALDTTSFGLRWRTVKGGRAQWSGTGVCWLDYGDSKQQQLINEIISATPSFDLEGVLFGTNVGKQWYASAMLSGFAVVTDQGGIVEATFNFEGKGPVLPNWI